MDILNRYIAATWEMTAGLAPWLLVGFLIAGAISIFLRRSTVVRFLGRPGLGSIVRATLIGVPMPLCSCGVIPVAAAIREKGAGRGATAAFLASTPETGADSFIATWGMLGPLMAIVRVVLAFVNGILAGLLVTLVNRGEKEDVPPATSGAVDVEKRGFGDAVRYALISMPSDMAASLVFGILLAGAVSAFIPADFVTAAGVSGIAAYALVTLFAIPLYVCSVGSIPLAVAMIHAGFSPGAALVFLVAGPATNIATIATMRKYLGGRSVAAYVLSIVVTAWTAGTLVDLGLGRETMLGQMPHAMDAPGMVGSIAAVVLIILIAHGWLTRHFKPLLKSAAKRKAGESCCCHEKAKAGESCCGGHSDRNEEKSGECCCGHFAETTKADEECHCDRDESAPARPKSGCGCGGGNKEKREGGSCCH
ncbi:MAG TPA: permease [Opitutales bacterium]|mgnify:CR=1 FL=1|nr:permease [Opitutales bacterium]